MMSSSDPNQPIQNYEIVNPTLELQVSSLLPSVAGYGGNLRSTNTIIPIVDLTSAAEGTLLPVNLQQALSFQGVTAFAAVGGTATLANVPGFYRIFGNASGQNASGAQEAAFNMTDGASTKIIWSMGTSGAIAAFVNFDFIVYLAAGESIIADSGGANMTLKGCTRQVATNDGTLVDPAGFS